MKLIQLTQGQFAKVSDHRFEYLNQWEWAAAWNEHTQSYYAIRTDRSLGKKTIRMHRVIMNTPPDMQCDHEDHDTLNNQDENLRNCTRSQNMMNRKINKNNTTGYKGVFRNGKNWRTEVNINGVQVFNKTYSTIEDAARAYDEKARVLYGEFARLNFP